MSAALPADRAVSGARRHQLGFRRYPARAARERAVAIVMHGSSGSSGSSIHVLSTALAARGVETWAVDIRGHGASGTRGDIGYLGQLEDDLADFVAKVRKTNSAAPLTLIGHSAGGGFALRVAGRRSRTCSRARCCWRPISATTRRPTGRTPAAGPAPTFRASSALSVLRRIGIDLLRIAADARVCGAAEFRRRSWRSTYTYRLMRNFANRPDYRGDLAAASKPVTIFAGAADELMLPDKYARSGARHQPRSTSS